MTIKLLVSILLLASFFELPAQQPDTILFHGNILTGSHLRPNDPSPTPARVSAVAIAKGRIVAIGTDSEIIRLKLPTTRLIDLKGSFALPGFNDAHVHLAAAGQQKLALDLDQVPTLAAMLQKIQLYAGTKAPGAWLQGGGWDHTLWPNKQLPTRRDLDKVTDNHPTILWRTDGHMAVANSAALAIANITSATPDPPGAKIDRDADRDPTGILRETAATNLIFSKVPSPTPEDRRRALEVAIADALAHGVTSVQDFSDWDDFLSLETMEHAVKLKLRVSEWLDFDLPVETLKSRQASHPKGDPLLHTGMLKAFMDGSLGSRTAALAVPYTDDPSNSGIARYDQAKIDRMSSERTAAGFQLGFHAIGDRANRIALNALIAAEEPGGPAPDRHYLDPTTGLVAVYHPKGFATIPEPDYPRNRIEHAQVVLPSDFYTFHEAHIIASMQPSHLLTDMAWAEARLGPERAKYAYAWRSFLDHGVTLAFGTDYPVESINPMRGLYAALTRQNEAGTMTFHPEQAINLNQALYAYTQASAYADFSESFRARLEPGYLADIVVLDRDLTTATPREILNTKVLRTMVNGETVYTAPAQ